MQKDIVFGVPSFLPSFQHTKVVDTLCVFNSSYSFMRIFSKLYKCYKYLKICMWFGYYPQIIFCHFFRKLNLVILDFLYYQSEYIVARAIGYLIVGTLCAQLRIQYYADSFETSQVFWPWSGNMHVGIILRLFCHFSAS